MIKALKRFFGVEERYDEEWDYALNVLLDKYPITLVDKYQVKLGGISIWIENEPYADCVPYDTPSRIYRCSQPSIETCRRFREALYKARRDHWLKAAEDVKSDDE